MVINSKLTSHTPHLAHTIVSSAFEFISLSIFFSSFTLHSHAIGINYHYSFFKTIINIFSLSLFFECLQSALWAFLRNCMEDVKHFTLCEVRCVRAHNNTHHDNNKLSANDRPPSSFNNEIWFYSTQTHPLFAVEPVSDWNVGWVECAMWPLLT